MENSGELDFEKIRQFLGGVSAEEAGLKPFQGEPSNLRLNEKLAEPDSGGLHFIADGFSLLRNQIDEMTLIPNDDESWHLFDYLEELSQFGVPVPSEIDITQISPDQIKNWRNEDYPNQLKTFFGVLENLNHAMAGHKLSKNIYISEAAAGIAYLPGLTLNEVKAWFKVIEDFSDVEILSGDDYTDYQLILDLNILEGKKKQAEYLKNHLKQSLVKDITYQIGNYSVISELVDHSFNFVGSLYDQTAGDFNDIDELNPETSYLKEKISTAAKEFLTHDEVAEIFDKIDDFYSTVKPFELKYPIFEKSSYN